MKVLKAKVYVDQSNGSTKYTYPQVWLDNKERIPEILYPNDRTDQGTDQNGTYQWVYPIVPDDVAAELTKLDEFEIADRIELETYAAKHAPVIERVTNPDKVISVLAKIARGEELTKQDTDTIDPEKPESGIVKTKPWLEEAEAKYGLLA